MNKKADMRIAVLGWGSLIWDKRPEFDEKHGKREYEGPVLKLEFSRLSESRKGALTLVIDDDYGQDCTVQYALSTRKDPADAIADLRCREGTIMKRMGFWFADGSQTCEPPLPPSIPPWAQAKNMDAVVWTGLTRNFEKEASPGKKSIFSVETATAYVQNLPAEGKAMAAEYIWRAPDYVTTPLRTALLSAPWFPPQAE
jgi:hypothetical protein